MAKKILIDAGAVKMTATLNESTSAQRLWDVLPVRSSSRRWGKEVYFEVPMHVDAEDAQAEVPSGTVAFWPEGDCLCLFFGQKPYSPVNVVGTLDGDAQALAAVGEGQPIEVRRA